MNATATHPDVTQSTAHDTPDTASGSAPANPADQPPAVERLAAGAHAAIDQAAAKAGPMLEKVQEKVHGMNDVSGQWMQNCREQVRQHPLSAVGLGLLAGWLLAKAGGRPPRW